MDIIFSIKNRIKRWSEDNPLIFYIGINAIELLLFVFAFNMHYETNDDPGIESIVSGVMGSYDYHTFFNNGMLSFIQMELFKYFPIVNWYTVTFVFIIFTSFNVIISVIVTFRERLGAVFGYLLIATYILAVSYYEFLQFTRVPGIAAIAAVLLYVSVLIYPVSKRSDIIRFCVASILLWISVWIRMESAIAIGIVCIPFGVSIICKYVKEKETKRFKNFVIAFMIPLILCVIMVWQNNLMYEVEPYRSSAEFNRKRGELMDWGWPKYDNYSALYEEINISENAYNNYIAWDFDDSELFTGDKMDRLIEARGYSGYFREHDISKLLLSFFGALRNLFTMAPFFVLIGVSVLLMCNGRIETQHALYTFLGMLGTEFLLAMMKRTQLERVDTIIISAAVYVLILFEIISDETPCKTSETRVASPMKICFWMFMIVVIAFNLLDGYSYYGYEKNMVTKQELSRYMCSDRSHNYVMPTWDGIPRTFDIWEVQSFGYADNQFTFGGWISRMPVKQNQMKDRGITNLYKDLIDREDMYLGIIDQDLQLKLDYIKENYAPNAEAILAKSLNGVRFYKIVTCGDLVNPNIDSFEPAPDSMVYGANLGTDEDGKPFIMGECYMPGLNSYQQEVYVGIPNGDAMEYHRTTQLVYDDNITPEEGRYGEFIYNFDDLEADEIDMDRIVVLYSNGTNRYIING